METREVAVTIKKSLRARRIRITVRRDGTVVVTQPRFASARSVERFVREKRDWIEQKAQYFLENPAPPASVRPRLGKKDFLAHKPMALALAEARLAHFNKHYGLEYNAVSIRNQKSRWGSCSSKRNLNFNYKIVFLTPEQQDYIVVHELCHLAQMNHGPKFWSLVAEHIPNHKAVRKEVRKFPL